MVKTLVALADRLVARVVPNVESHAACQSCAGLGGCRYPCCGMGGRVDLYRCCLDYKGDCYCNSLGQC